MNREREHESAVLDAQTLETIRLLAEDLVTPVSEYESYVPGSQKSIAEKLAPFAALDRIIAAGFAAEDDARSSLDSAQASSSAGTAPSPRPTPTAASAKAQTAPREASAPGRLSVLLEQLQERARMRRERGHGGSRLIKAEDFERREPTLGGSESTAGEAAGPRLGFDP